MATEKFANEAQSILSGSILSTDNSLTIVSAAHFPATGQFRIRIDNEILLVLLVSSNTFSVARGQEGTTAVNHEDGALVTHVLTAGALTQFGLDTLDASTTMVDTIAALRLRIDSPRLVFVRRYSVAGTEAGGGLFDLMVGDTTTPDNGGTHFVNAAGARYRRRWSESEPLLVDWFGACGNYDPGSQTGVNSTAAFEACWAAAATLSNRIRAIRFGRGFYYLTHAFEVTDAWDVRGVGNSESILWFVTAGTHGIIIAPNHPEPYANAVTLKDFWIAGPANCGLAALECEQNLLEFDIDLAITGGWSWGFHADGGGDPGLGALQWGKMRLTSITSQGNVWAADAKPTNYFYNRGYINACKLHLEILGSSGTGITLIGSYLGATYSELTGTTQGCGRSLEFTDIGSLSVHDFYSETDGVGVLTRCTCNFYVGSAELNAIACDGLSFYRWNGRLNEDSATFGTKMLSHSFYWFNKTNLSQVMQSPQIDLAHTTLRDYDTPGNHDFDPPNSLVNGDFSRWIGNVPAGCVGNFQSVRCGIGQTDTTHSSGAPNCVRVSPEGTTTFGILLPQMSSEMLGCYVSVQFKAMIADESGGIITWSTKAGNEAVQFFAKGFGSVTCGDGFSLYASTFRVTQNMVDHGVALLLSATLSAAFYLSEVSCVIGGVVPRYFTRCSEKQGIAAELQADGRIHAQTSASTPAATDPLFGLAWLNGDRVSLTTPLSRAYDVLEGWVRANGAWVEVTQSENSANLNTIADLRALTTTPSLVYVRRYAAAGTESGGGWFDLMVGDTTTADNGGIYFVTAGGARYRRRGGEVGPILVDWFGACGDFNPGTLVGTDSTAAILAAGDYVRALPVRRSLRYGGGCYRQDAPVVVRNHWTIEGTGLWSTQIWGSAAGVFVLGARQTDGIHIYAEGIVIRDLWICGPADIGGYAIEVPHCLLHFDIKVACTGGYENAFRCAIVGSHGNDAALQWGDLSMYSTFGQDSLAPGTVWAMPHDYFYSIGYFNACKLRFEIRRSLGTAITCIGEYNGADYSEITGSVQECGQAVYVRDVGKLTFHNFYSESDGATPLVIENSRVIFREGGSGLVTLINCQDVQFDSWQGPYSEDINTSGTRTTNSAVCPIARSNNSAVMLGAAESANFDLDRRYDLPGYGDADPPNMAINGDFCRWSTPLRPANFISNFNATKCGVGCVDTTRTLNAPHCARFESVGGSVFVMYLIPAPLQHFLGGKISISFKARPSVEGNTIAYAISPQNELRIYGDADRALPCENGFRTYMVCARITQDFIDHGLMLTLSSQDYVPFYVSEISACYGSIVPRYFERVSSFNGADANLLPSGNLETYVSSVPVATVDPMFGDPWLSGDTALLRTTTLVTTDDGVPTQQLGWRYSGTAWVPIYSNTSLACTSNQTVDTIAALRLLTSSPRVVYVRRYSVAGTEAGGGWFELVVGDTTTADDGGIFFVTAGGARYRRRDSAGSHAHLTWWGADSTGVVACDSAWEAAYTWVKVDSYHRGLHIPDGVFLLSTSHNLNATRTNITGNGRTSCLWFNGGPTLSLFMFTQNALGLTLKNFLIGGGAACGRAAFDLSTEQGNWLEFDVDLIMRGGWTYWIHANGVNTASGRGAFQWGVLKLSNIEDSFPGSGYHYPVNAIYIDGGYANDVKFFIEVWFCSGDAFHYTEMTDYAGGGFWSLTGSCQGCGRGVYKKDGSFGTIFDFYTEANTNPDVYDTITGFRFEKYYTSQINLIAARSCTFKNCGLQIVEDANCFQNDYTDSGVQNRAISMVNRSSTTYRGFSTAYNERSEGGYGKIDPQNILLGGDHAVWIPENRMQVRSVFGNYSATKCGEGCTDTTATYGNRWCALFAFDPLIPAGSWYLSYRLCGPVESSLRNCLVTFSFKARARTGNLLTQLATVVGANLNETISMSCGVEVENGFTQFVVTRPFNADMLANGVSLLVIGQNSLEAYISEVSACIGHWAPREFHHCSTSFFWPQIEVDLDGHINGHYSALPGANDPVWNRPWQPGDRITLPTPTVRAYDILLGWRRVGTSWVEVTQPTDITGSKHLMTADVSAVGTSTALSGDLATETLSQTLTGLAASSRFNATVGFRTVFYLDSDHSVCGSVDETVDIYIVTDGSSVATCSIIGAQVPDTSRLHASLLGATSALATITGGIRVTATRPSTLACHARTRLWISNIEDIT